MGTVVFFSRRQANFFAPGLSASAGKMGGYLPIIFVASGTLGLLQLAAQTDYLVIITFFGV